MKNGTGFFSGLFLGVSVTIVNLPANATDGQIKVQEIKNYSNCKTSGILNIYNRFIKTYEERVSFYEKCFQTQEEKKLFREVMNNDDFKIKLFNFLKFEDNSSIEKIILSAILGFLYGFAYLKTIRKVKGGMPIDISSFTTFSLTSGGMVLVNGVLPGSIVYLESFLLAGYVVYLHLNNVINEGKDKIEEITPEEYNAIVLIGENLDRAGICFSYYDINGKPVYINKTLEKISGFTYQDYLNSWEEATESEKKYAVMKLQYKGENLKKVLNFVGNVDTSGGYRETFTMDTAHGNEAILLWTTIPNGKGGTLRTAVELTDIDEIKRELEKTRIATRTDKLTKVLNLRALHEDLHQTFTHFNREGDPRVKTAVIIDLDNFKGINDILGHNAGDEVLVKFVDFIHSHIRAGDSFYRIGGDEFVIIFDSDDIDFITKKINELREGFLNIVFPYKIGGKSLKVSSSWGFKTFDVKDYYSEGLTEEEVENIFKYEIKQKADYYMYAVKYFRYILPELELRGLDLSQIDEKNGQAYPLYERNGEFIGVKVIKTGITFDLSVEELKLIGNRKEDKAKEITNREQGKT